MVNSKVRYWTTFIGIFVVTFILSGYIFPYEDHVTETQEEIIDTIIDTSSTSIGIINGFDLVIPFVLKHEGDVFVKDTTINEISRMGISLSTYRSYYGRGDINSIRNLTYTEASTIYKKLFWDKNSLDSIVNIGYIKTVIILMDSEVNLGSYRANKFLQEIVGVPKTGIVDDATLSGLRNTTISDNDMYRLLLKKRRHYYSGLVRRRPVFARYHVGWNNRLDDITEFVKEI